MIKGNLHQRAILNKDRLLGELYSYPSVFQQPSTWPGDFPGRALLGLASLYFAFQGEIEVQNEIKRRIDCLLSHLKEFTNEDFYFGPTFDESILNEQQFAGNSWYIRGLCCAYEIEREPTLLAWIRHIEESFLLKAAKAFVGYPVEKRSKEGGVAGHLCGRVSAVALCHLRFL